MQKWTICAEYVDLLDEHNPEKKETQIYSWKSKNEVISLNMKKYVQQYYHPQMMKSFKIFF